MRGLSEDRKLGALAMALEVVLIHDIAVGFLIVGDWAAGWRGDADPDPDVVVGAGAGAGPDVGSPSSAPCPRPANGVRIVCNGDPASVTLP